MPTEDINASAEAFIKNFRHHLLLQRLQSIENHKQMLAKGKVADKKLMRLKLKQQIFDALLELGIVPNPSPMSLKE
ncbi:hypothetical protein JHK87_017358 [Glycine soja]|nr:hypothetical protein JHK87_017358 [Glycine soja]